MWKVIVIVGIVIGVIGEIIKSRSAKQENLEKNVHGILDTYEDDDIVSDEDWGKCIDYINKPLRGIVLGCILIMAGSVITVFGAFSQLFF